MKTPRFPVAMFLEADGIPPAILFTFTNWMVIKNGLVREYIWQREFIAERAARVADREPDSLDSLGMLIVTSARAAALELYRVGYEAHRNNQGVFGCNYLTPEGLIELGDKHACRAFDAEVKRLAEGKEKHEQARA